LGNVVVLVAAISSIYLTRAGTLKPGTAGWGLTQALSITGLLTWAVRVLTDLESQMMSVVRISEMIPDASGNPLSSPWNSTKTIPVENEAPGVAFGTDISPILSLRRSPCTDKAIRLSGWPWKGGVEFKNVSMRYQLDLPLALQNVNISVPPGSTLAVVGKTGSGKSSLLLTLFRLVEIEKHGSIEIDHVDIRSISLQSLREILSIIPQDPILFSGSLKYNLDATGNVSEEDAWRALDAACPELANQARLSGLGLDFPINEGGKNLSAGQRQLVW
jgi:ABC-type multidrug transport system fused ATPase/permease subunit